jgi:hypothetical protein
MGGLIMTFRVAAMAVIVAAAALLSQPTAARALDWRNCTCEEELFIISEIAAACAELDGPNPPPYHCGDFAGPGSCRYVWDEGLFEDGYYYDYYCWEQETQCTVVLDDGDC